MPQTRPQVLKARVANRPPSGGTSAPSSAGPKYAPGSGGTQAPGGGGGYTTGITGGSKAAANRYAPGTTIPTPHRPAAAPPAAPAAPGEAPMPWDAQYNTSVAGAEKRYGDTIASLGAKRVIEQQNYGIDPGFNDYANNPYSRAALLRQSWNTANRGTTNSYAAAGHLYGGSTVNAIHANEGQYNQGYDALNKEYLHDMAAIGQEEAQALEDRENRKEEAGWQRLQTAQSEPLEPETSPEPGGGGNVNKKAKQKRAAKKKGKK